MGRALKEQEVSDGRVLGLDDLVPRPLFTPGEDQTAYEGFRAAILGKLAPSTPYEQIVAEKILALEWEQVRRRETREQVILLELRRFLLKTLDERPKPNHSINLTERQIALTDAVFDEDHPGREIALEVLEDEGYTLGGAIALAHLKASQFTTLLDKSMADLERRVRRLHEDYETLKASRKKPLEEAEVVDTC
jgi:hypothetical protein